MVLVTGAPGTGKSTLGPALAGTVGCPVVSRDEIRVGVVHAGTPDEGFLHTLDVPTLVVDTGEGYRPSLAAIAEFAFA